MMKPYVPPQSAQQTAAQRTAFQQHQINLTQQKGGDQVAPDMGNKAANENGVKALEVSARLAEIQKAQGLKGGRPRKSRRFKTHKYIKRNYGRSKRFRIFRKHSRQTKK
jgi:hypothetical protein